MGMSKYIIYMEECYLHGSVADMRYPMRDDSPYSLSPITPAAPAASAPPLAARLAPALPGVPACVALPLGMGDGREGSTAVLGRQRGCGAMVAV
jgi:hypothetical protein